MTAHQLAKKLLEMPDLTVVSNDGKDPSDYQLVEPNIKDETYYWTGDEWKIERCIIL